MTGHGGELSAGDKAQCTDRRVRWERAGNHNPSRQHKAEVRRVERDEKGLCSCRREGAVVQCEGPVHISTPVPCPSACHAVGFFFAGGGGLIHVFILSSS